MDCTKLRRSLLLGALACAALVGCGDDDDVMDPVDSGLGTLDSGRPDGGLGMDANLGGDSGSDAGNAPPVATCPAESARTAQVAMGAITSNTTWTCDKIYSLSGYVVVKGGATLKIDPGTIVRGDGSSALFITREGKIDAQGTKDLPIVFTAVGAPGARVSGGWQGLVLLGKASLNVPTGDREFEGLTTNNPDYRYGGTDDAHSCGTLRYVRIEFAGHELQPMKELNSLTLAGCGSGTVIDYVQSHKGKDDGFEFFGGTASAKHLVSTGSDDDNIDYDEGWRGNLQFVAVQQHDLSGAGDSNGIEASNIGSSVGPFSSTPLSSPRIYNVTLIGDRQATHRVRAMLLKDATGGEIKNVLAQGFATVGIDVVTAEAADHLRATPPTLSVTNSLFYEIGADGRGFFPLGDDMDTMGALTDGSLDEDLFFRDAARALKFEQDPKLRDPYNVTAPGWVPAADSPAASGGATPPSDAFFDATATYLGAFKPGGDDWTAGWTAYPAN